MRINCLGNFLRLIEQFKDTLGRGHRRLNHIGDIGQRGDRLGKLLGILNKRLHISNGYAPVCHHDAAHHGHDDIAEVANKAHERHNHS